MEMSLDYSKLTVEELTELTETLEQIRYIDAGRKIDTFYATETDRKSYTKQMDFYKLGNTFDQRLFMAANRTGKTLSGAYELTCHATGIYPTWWEGKRFNKPLNICVAGQNGKTVRDILQKELIGLFSEAGTGMIPRELLGRINKTSGLADCIESFDVKHSSGGKTVIFFKAYEQGSKSFEGTIYDVVWLDEEPRGNDANIYAEVLTRTATVAGILIITFTPLDGPTELVTGFMNAKEGSGKVFVNQTWDDVPHLTEKVKRQLLESYPPYQRDARSKGIPMLGAGAIYPIQEETFVIPPIEIPKHWKRLFGLDVGWNNTAVAWIAIDPDTDIIYMYSDYKAGHQEPYVHAAGIKARGNWIPGVIDPASIGSGQIDGEKVMDKFVEAGLQLDKANNAVEAGIYEVWQRLSLGKLKVFSNCQLFLTEFRLYRRDTKGKIIKKDDHIMDALRYAINTIDYAKTQVGYSSNTSYHGTVGI